MNPIYKKLKPKRKYTKKAKCENKLGLCDAYRCRCDMSYKPAKNVITEPEHTAKIISRKWDLNRMKADIDNQELIEEVELVEKVIKPTIGEYRKRKEQYQRIKFRAFVIMWIYIIIVVGYCLIQMFN